MKKGKKGNWEGGRKQTTLWEIDKPQRSDTGHSTQKPVDCMRIPIENNSKAGDKIYEPFSGSGTTIIAAEMTGRACYAMELNPLYVDMAVKRWQNFTGKKAVNAATGKPFDHIGEVTEMVKPDHIARTSKKVSPKSPKVSKKISKTKAKGKAA